MQGLEAHEVPLHKVFSSDYDFWIPVYQRPYAWDADQACQLLEDLVETLKHHDDDPYFLGSIVLVKSGASASAEVIDGQQRLTTLTILLAVLRDRSTDPALAGELDRMIQEPGSILQSLAPKPRLTLRPRDGEFFRDRVQAVGATRLLLDTSAHKFPTDAQRAVRLNAAALDSVLADWSHEQVIELVQLLATRTFLVVVTTPNLESAHRIFSVMNARGLDLSPADIFKSTVVGQIRELSSEAEADAARRWEDAEELLGREDFADLFLHVRMIFSKERARRELLREFPQQVLSQYLPDRANEFVDAVLVPYADAYARIRDYTYVGGPGAERINAWFKRLDQIDNNDWRAPALWALHHHGDDVDWLDQFFRALERITASMFIRRVYTTPRVTRFAALLKGLDDGQGLDTPAFGLSDEEKAETLARLNADIYMSTKVRRSVLLRLDELLAKSPGVTYAHRLITVEHVLPQTPHPGSQWLTDFTDEARTRWTHRLANLVLLNRQKNSEAQNYDFELKKARYFTGGNGVAAFALTTQVLAHGEWTPGALEARQEKLVGVLAQEWSL